MSLPPQYRSKKGRRPPYHLCSLKPNEHIDDVDFHELETGAYAFLDQHEKEGKPLLVGLREWNLAHEAIIRWFYEPGSPCLVNPLYPNQHVRFLSEISSTSRYRGRDAVLSNAKVLGLILNNPDYTDHIVGRWKNLSAKAKRELVLKTFGDIARDEEAAKQDPFGRARKLMPEVTVSEFCADEGKGLLRFLDVLQPHTLNPESFISQPIYNKKFFKKFGIQTSSEQNLPLSKADRAMQEEQVLLRNSYLIHVAQSMCLSILGGKMPKFKGVGLFNSDLANRHSDPYDDIAVNKDSNPDTLEEVCSSCHRTAKQADVPRLLYCQKCREVGRVQPYCSAGCQKAEWKSHRGKGRCGSKISEFVRVPNIDYQAPASDITSDCHSLRPFIRAALHTSSAAFWADQVDQDSAVTICFSSPDKELQDQITSSLRFLAFNALLYADSTAIDVLSVALMIPNYQLRRTVDGSNSPQIPETLSVEEFKLMIEHGPIARRVEAFRAMFALENDEDWTATKERGNLELEKPENSVIKEFIRLQRAHARERQLQILATFANSNELSLPDDLGLEKFVIDTFNSFILDD